MTQTLSIISIVVAVGTVVVSLVIARRGWARDQRNRDLTLRAECAKALSRLIQARTAPLMDPTWDTVNATLANAHHIEALAAMTGMSPGRRDDTVVRFFADQSFIMQQEAIRYVTSGEPQMDREGNKIGPRLRAILSAAAHLQDDLIGWQDSGSTHHLRTFWSHYADNMLRVNA